MPPHGYSDSRDAVPCGQKQVCPSHRVLVSYGAWAAARNRWLTLVYFWEIAIQNIGQELRFFAGYEGICHQPAGCNCSISFGMQCMCELCCIAAAASRKMASAAEHLKTAMRLPARYTAQLTHALHSKRNTKDTSSELRDKCPRLRRNVTLDHCFVLPHPQLLHLINFLSLSQRARTDTSPPLPHWGTSVWGLKLGIMCASALGCAEVGGWDHLPLISYTPLMSTTLPVRLSTMRTTYGLRRTIRNSWMSAHCGKSSHMKKSSTLPTHHKRGDEREGGNEDGERERMVMQMKTSDQACVHQSQIHSQSLYELKL